MPITFYETLTENEILTKENHKWIHGVLNRNGMWSESESQKVLKWIANEYEASVDNHDVNHGLKEIRGEIYTEMEDGVIPLGYSYDSLLEELDDLLNEMNSNHEETSDDHGVDVNEIVDKFFCE